MWRSSWAAVSSLALGTFTLADFFGLGRNPWWLRLVVGLFFVVLVGSQNSGEHSSFVATRDV